MAEGKCHSIWRIVQRKRVSKTDRLESISLRRCLNSWDLTALGVGRTLGIGVYVLIGGVALRIAGPSVVLSFLIAAVAALLAGLCYAEFGARVPLAGSAFIYTYVTIGELVAFMVGWLNILEFVFASASIGRTLGLYVDIMSNHSMSAWFLQAVPVAGYPLSPYFDLFSFLLVLMFGIILAVGVRESSLVNMALCAISLVFVLVIVFMGASTVDATNWSIPAGEVPAESGGGGFFPFGVWGTLKGAAVCFYGFVGFEVVNSAVEEVKNPRVTIPTSIVAIISVVFLMYAGVSIVLTMMVPYHDIVSFASLSTAFTYVGWNWPRWLVNIGAVFALATSLYGALFPLPRLLHSMAADGLFFPWFAKVSSSKQSPIIATIVPTIVIALLAGLFDLDELVHMLCIGTLTSFTLVAVCVVLLRHRSYYIPDEKASLIKQIFGLGGRKATRRSKRIVDILMVVYICLCIVIAVICVHTTRPLVAVIILHVLAIFTVFIMALQPANEEELSFKTPLVPFLPCLSIYGNVHLAVCISWHSWVRIVVWLVIGIPIYFLCVSCFTQTASGIEDEDNHANENGKRPTVQIVVQSPTPPQTIARFNSYGDQINNINMVALNEPIVPKLLVDKNKIEHAAIQEIQIENSEEKEAKIIDLLDQVLQAEEDSYAEVVSLNDTNSEVVALNGDDSVVGIPHRKSLSELSDAGSDASMGNLVLSKYDVIVQVHREDLPKLREEEEERGDISENGLNYDDEEITAFNDSDTNSRTDESGYSDTIDRPILGESIEDTTVSNIPVPPPFDENYFKTPALLSFKKIPDRSNSRSDTISKSTSGESIENTDVSNIPVPPPFDENYFKTPAPLVFKKINTPPENAKGDVEVNDDNNILPRSSLQSNNSQGDGNIRFGSSRQISLMSKLNVIFQKTIDNEEEEPRKRSKSTGNAIEAELVLANRERPQVFLDLKKELLARDSLPTLRPVNSEVEKPVESKPVKAEKEQVVVEEEEEDQSMSRKDLRSKLENIFSGGGPQLLAKPMLRKSNSMKEESNETDTSSTESIPKLPKMEKNDTLKRQKEKFSHVLNSIRLSMNSDDQF